MPSRIPSPSYQTHSRANVAGSAYSIANRAPKTAGDRLAEIGALLIGNNRKISTKTEGDLARQQVDRKAKIWFNKISEAPGEDYLKELDKFRVESYKENGVHGDLLSPQQKDRRIGIDKAINPYYGQNFIGLYNKSLSHLNRESVVKNIRATESEVLDGGDLIEGLKSVSKSASLVSDKAERRRVFEDGSHGVVHSYILGDVRSRISDIIRTESRRSLGILNTKVNESLRGTLNLLNDLESLSIETLKNLWSQNPEAFSGAKSLDNYVRIYKDIFNKRRQFLQENVGSEESRRTSISVLTEDLLNLKKSAFGARSTGASLKSRLINKLQGLNFNKSFKKGTGYYDSLGSRLGDALDSSGLSKTIPTREDSVYSELEQAGNLGFSSASGQWEWVIANPRVISILGPDKLNALKERTYLEDDSGLLDLYENDPETRSIIDKNFSLREGRFKPKSLVGALLLTEDYSSISELAIELSSASPSEKAKIRNSISGGLSTRANRALDKNRVAFRTGKSDYTQTVGKIKALLQNGLIDYDTYTTQIRSVRDENSGVHLVTKTLQNSYRAHTNVVKEYLDTAFRAAKGNIIASRVVSEKAILEIGFRRAYILKAQAFQHSDLHKDDIESAMENWVLKKVLPKLSKGLIPTAVSGKGGVLSIQYRKVGTALENLIRGITGPGLREGTRRDTPRSRRKSRVEDLIDSTINLYEIKLRAKKSAESLKEKQKATKPKSKPKSKSEFKKPKSAGAGTDTDFADDIEKIFDLGVKSLKDKVNTFKGLFKLGK